MNFRKFLYTWLMIIPLIGNTQISPDTLTGTYVGEYWFKWKEDTTWTITTDTVYVTDINSTCQIILLSNYSWLGGYWVSYETTYDFCEGISSNWFRRFHSIDSLTIIFDDVSPPPPDYHVSSTRFLGKKISSDVSVRKIESDTGNIVLGFPNPFKEEIHISFHNEREYTIQLLNINGNIIIKTNGKSENFSLNTQNLPNGIYILQLISKNTIKNIKLLKN